MATSTLRTTTTVRTGSLCVASQHQSSENLLTDLFLAYRTARANKRNTHSQMRFESRLSDNLIDLYDDIASGRYRVGRSMCFIVRDPVQREVFAASFRDRVVHHLLYNWLSPLFESRFIADSYSCRKEKGTLYGIKRLQDNLLECSKGWTSPCYVLKLDVSGYFMSIDRHILYTLVMEGIRDVPASAHFPKPIVERLLEQVIFNDPTKGCRIKGRRSDWNGLPPSKSLFFSSPDCGLPIGNLTSQLFSNVFLSPLDIFVTGTLGIKRYGRYVDDFYLVSPSREELLAAIPEIRRFLSDRLHLRLHPHKVYLQDARKGVRFLGAVVKPSGLYPSKRFHKGFESNFARIYDLSDNEFAIAAVRQSYIGYLSHFNHYDL